MKLIGMQSYRNKELKSKMEIQRKEVNYIYFFFDRFGKRVPLIAGADLGNNLDSEIHPNSILKKMILEQLPKDQTSKSIYLWIDGTEFKIGQVS